jgi:uncharacterized membrane protein YciS (DUF1049 family)
LSQELSVKSVRAAYVVTLSMIVLAVSAAPAAAAPQAISDSAVLASEKFKWFYWLGILIAAGLLLWLLATLVGYYIRVMRPKHRGREVS